MNSFRRKRKYNMTRRRKYLPTEIEKDRMLLVNKLYVEYGTLDKVGSLLRLTRERVRQLLKKGERYHLFTYELTRDKRFNETLARIDKEQLRDLVKITKNQFDICLKLGIDINTLQRLIKYYNIDLESYKQDARYRRYLMEYSEIVKTLGYHPSTTVLQHNKKWRKIAVGIDRLWGGFDKFRNEFGIERPKHSMHPNTLAAWNLTKEKRIARKREKINNVYGIIQTNKKISLRKVMEITGYGYGSVSNYINDLLKNGRAKRVGKGGKIKYRVI